MPLHHKTACHRRGWSSLLTWWVERWGWRDRSQNQLSTPPPSSWWPKTMMRRWNPFGVWRDWLNSTCRQAISVQNLRSFIFWNYLKMLLIFRLVIEKICSKSLDRAHFSWWTNIAKGRSWELPTDGDLWMNWRPKYV
jgi:hypothetical protein